MLAKDEVLQKLVTIKHDATLLGFKKLGLFGSFATNQHSSMSDIDIAVVSDKNITGKCFKYLENLEMLKEKLYALFHRPIDVYDLNRHKDTPLTKQIKDEVIYV